MNTHAVESELLENREAASAPTSLRVTVNLSERSARALRGLVGLTGETKTEAINKAIQVYELVQAAQSEGGGLYIRENKDSDLVRVRFF